MILSVIAAYAKGATCGAEQRLYLVRSASAEFSKSTVQSLLKRSSVHCTHTVTQHYTINNV